MLERRSAACTDIICSRDSKVLKEDDEVRSYLIGLMDSHASFFGRFRNTMHFFFWSETCFYGVVGSKWMMIGGLLLLYSLFWFGLFGLLRLLRFREKYVLEHCGKDLGGIGYTYTVRLQKRAKN